VACGTAETETVLSVKEEDIANLFETIDKHASTNVATREFLLMAMVKLVDRIKTPSFQARAEQFLERFTNEYNLELHERSAEFQNILKSVDSSQGLNKVIGPVPPFPLKKDVLATGPDTPSKGTSPAAEKRSAPAAAAPEQPKAPQPTSILDDLDLLAGGVNAAAPAVSSAAPGADLMASLFGGAPGPVAAAPGSGGISDLLGLGLPAPTPTVAAPLPVFASAVGTAAPVLPLGAAPLTPLTPGFSDIIAFSKDGISISFSFQKNPQNAAHTLVNVSILSVRPSPCSDVSFQISVPKYIKFQVAPASAKDLLPNGQNKILIPVKLNNTEHGQRPILMKIRLEFTYMGQKTVEVADVNNLPQGL
jgi:AP-1 complex subunit gamma-1